jgi:hypothetical protein
MVGGRTALIRGRTARTRRPELAACSCCSDVPTKVYLMDLNGRQQGR